MKITNSQFLFKNKQVGQSRGAPIYYALSKGGYHMIMSASGKVLGASSAPSVARHLAMKYDPEIEWTDLEKNEGVDFSMFAHLIPKYDRLTQELQHMQEALENDKA